MITILIAIAAFIAGVLVGRANPKKATQLADYATNLKNKVTGITKG